MKIYRIIFFEKLPGGGIYGGQSFTGNLDRAHKRLVKRFGLNAEVRMLWPGKYSIAGGLAEMEEVGG